MGATGTPTILDGWRLAAAIGPGSYEQYLISFAGGSGATDYATNGQPFTMPTDIKGVQFVALEVQHRTPFTRNWFWNASQSAPKLVALDAFATEEGNGTTVNTDTLTALLTVKR